MAKENLENKLYQENLKRYEPAAVARVNMKKDPMLAILSIGDFYRLKLGEEDDPIINKAIDEALKGQSESKGEAGIANLGLIEAIKRYGGKYEGVFASTKLSGLVEYLTEGYKIPEEANEALKKYSKSTLVDLMEIFKDEKTPNEQKEEVQNAIITINKLKYRKLTESSLKIVNNDVYNSLSGLYSKKKEE